MTTCRLFRQTFRTATCVLPLLALLALTASVAVAQEESGPSIFIDPANIPSAAQDVEVNIYAYDGELFGSPAGKLPTVEFGPGVTLKSTQYISGKLIRCTVDTDADAFGAPEVRVMTWSLDGETVSILATTAIGVTGPATVTPLTLEATENAEVTPDISRLQAAGDLIVTGPLNGTVTVLAPAGVTFSTASTTDPEAKSLSVGTVVQPAQVSDDGSEFTFVVLNPTFKSIKVELSSLNLSLQSFTAAGGQEGEILFGVVLDGSQNSIGVSSAHTPGKTVTNPTDDQLEPPTNEAPSNETNTGGGGTPTGGDGSTPTSTGNTSSNPTNPSNNNSSNSTNPDNPRQPGDQADNQRQRGNGRAGLNRGNNRGRGNRRGRGRRGGRGGRPVVRGGSRGGGGSPGVVSGGGSGYRGGSSGAPSFAGGRSGDVVGDPDADNQSVTTDIVGSDPLIVVDSFTLCDEHFRPLGGVGFRPATDGSGDFEAIVRVQVVLSDDISPGRRGRLEVVIRVPGAEPMSAILEETGDDSGIYRSRPSGVTVRLRPQD